MYSSGVDRMELVNIYEDLALRRDERRRPALSVNTVGRIVIINEICIELRCGRDNTSCPPGRAGPGRVRTRLGGKLVGTVFDNYRGRLSVVVDNEQQRHQYAPSTPPLPPRLLCKAGFGVAADRRALPINAAAGERRPSSSTSSSTSSSSSIQMEMEHDAKRSIR